MEFTSKIQERLDKKRGPLTIVFFGASITQGCFDDYADHSAGYAMKLKYLIEKIYGDEFPISIVNAGIAGENAKRGSERLERDVISYNPDLCVMNFGMNDWGGDSKTSLELYKNSLSEIFEKLNAANIETLFMTPCMMATWVDEKNVAEENRDYVRKVVECQTSGIFDTFVEAAKETCKNHGVKVCDCYSVWKKFSENGVDTTKLLINRINHPTENMHWLFAYELLKTIMD